MASWAPGQCPQRRRLFGKDLHVHFGVQSARRTGTWAGLDRQLLKLAARGSRGKCGNDFENQNILKSTNDSNDHMIHDSKLNFGIVDHRIRPSEELVAYRAPFCSLGHGALIQCGQRNGSFVERGGYLYMEYQVMDEPSHGYIEKISVLRKNWSRNPTNQYDQYGLVLFNRGPIHFCMVYSPFPYSKCPELLGSRPIFSPSVRLRRCHWLIGS